MHPAPAPTAKQMKKHDTIDRPLPTTRDCSASVENAGLGIELTHCCLRKEQWYEQTRTAALQCPRESENSPAPFAGRQSGVGFMRTAPDHSQPVLSMAEAVFRERHAGL